MDEKACREAISSASTAEVASFVQALPPEARVRLGEALQELPSSQATAKDLGASVNVSVVQMSGEHVCSGSVALGDPVRDVLIPWVGKMLGHPIDAIRLLHGDVPLMPEESLAAAGISADVSLTSVLLAGAQSVYPGCEYHFRATLPLGQIDLWLFQKASETDASRRAVLQHQRPENIGKHSGITCRYTGKANAGQTCKLEAPDGILPWIVKWTHVADKLSDPGMDPNAKATKDAGFKKITNGRQEELVECSAAGAKASFHAPICVRVLAIGERSIMLTRMATTYYFADEGLRLERADSEEQVGRFPMASLFQEATRVLEEEEEP